MAAVTLVLGRYLAAGRQPRQRREDVRELCLDLIVERRERRRRQAGEVVVQRVHEDRERQVPLQLSRRPGKGELPGRLRAGSQPPPARPPPAAPPESSENLVNGTKFIGVPDEVLGKHGTAPPNP